MNLGAALQVAAVIISVLLIILILLQVKGGGLGSLLGGESGMGIARTRRGLEKTLYQLTIVMSIVFLAISIVAVLVLQ
jgi:preprotein translocase subunit SecG